MGDRRFPWCLLCCCWFLQAALGAAMPSVALLLVCGAAQECWVPFCCAQGAVPAQGVGSCCLVAPVWGRAGHPAQGRVRFSLDVGEEVEQHSSGGSDSAFSLLL